MDRHRQGRHPRAALAGAHIYHYGHVRRAAYMQAKLDQVSKYWAHGAGQVVYGNIDPQSLRPFAGSHPKLVEAWLRDEAEQAFEPNPAHALTRRERKHRWAMKLERLFGWDLSHKHYTLVANP